MTDPLYLLLGLILAENTGILIFLCIMWLRIDGDEGQEHV